MTVATNDRTAGQKNLSENRRARFDYEIIETLEVGLVLTGTEIKSISQGKGLIAESYASCEGGELWLINSHVPEYLEASRFNHEPRRRRKLLVHRKQLARLANAVGRDGMTLVPLRIYFNEKRKAKLELAVARGKKDRDKRETIKDREWGRQKQRLMKQNG
jgi:SsrA-binding protein